jgi:hypothetical protein
MTSGPVAVNLLFWLLPVLAFGVLGFHNTFGLDPHLYGLLYGGINAVYVLMEESGWRGFLQNSFQPLSPTRRYLFTGLIWWLWHTRFQHVFDWTVFPLVIVASAFGLGKMADTYRSYMVTAGLHLLIVLTTNTSGNTSAKIGASLLCIVSWVLLARRLKPTVVTKPVM